MRISTIVAAADLWKTLRRRNRFSSCFHASCCGTWERSGQLAVTTFPSGTPNV